MMNSRFRGLTILEVLIVLGILAILAAIVTPNIVGWRTDVQLQGAASNLKGDLEMAKARVAEAERAYERVKDGPDAQEIRKAELQLANVEAKLAVSQRNLDESEVIAPIDGTVMSVTADIGETVSKSFITVADLTQPYLEIYLDETDLDKIDLDYEVEVIFDALPDLVFTGHVVQLDPGLFSEGPISTVRGLVQLDSEGNPNLDRLLIGMNAAVDVIGGRAEDAVLVPVEALRELSPGEYSVFVLENDQPKLRFVEVGIMDFTYAEIISGFGAAEQTALFSGNAERYFRI